MPESAPPLSGEQEEAKRIAEKARKDALALLDGYRFRDGRQTSNRLSDRELQKLAGEYLALLAAYEDRSKAFERAAADCVRLEGLLNRALKLIRTVRATGSIYDRIVADYAALSPAEHLREAREVEQHQEEKHGE